ncbi:PREDICTED: protein GAMETE EXPRESSED 1-like [Theobroma cacao]|uniref:Protein GAMETE EXPRESSED 1-like n=1 Tax=Theobroma cacao TaxID=3641 RepID=A0AB32W9S0_THECC|nr:PREDICTED: protein GAMETE EXPRESSED 1-like [Theobroma cacao]
MIYHYFFLSLLVLLCVSLRCQSWGWFSSSAETHSNTKAIRHASVAEFWVDSLNDEKGIRLVEDAKNKLVGLNSCWKNAYRHLFAGCKEIIATDEKRSRFAWHQSDCFQRDSGRSPFPFCDTKSPMVYCLKNLNDLEHKVYLEFLLETNSICYQLQNQAFKHDAERLVNELINSAQYAEDKLDSIRERTNVLLQSSSQIHDSLNAVDIRIRNVDQTTHSLEGHMHSLNERWQTVHEQAVDIAASQKELQNGQAMMNDHLKEGLVTLDGAYKNLGHEVDNLRNEVILIENKTTKVGNAMSSSINNLQRTAADIANKAGISLDKQQEVLEGQSTALEGLRSLTRFQSEALEESRNTMQQFAECDRKQRQELLKRQERFQQVHDHLVESSKSILAAQEAVESKLARIFIVINKLHALHNAMLFESRLIKTFLVYSLSIFIIYMFTSTKQTYTVRPRLYIGLCATFLVEVAVLRLTTNDIEQKTWMVNLVRSLFVLIASIQLLQAIFTYRDYEYLNHQMLLTLMEEVNNIQSNGALSWETDSDVDWSSWIDDELAEDVDKLEDPDFIIQEEIGENLITTFSNTRKYNLRQC